MINRVSATLFCILILLFGGASAFSQPSDTGFFLMIESQANCTHKAHDLMGTETYCLPNEPLIAKTEFEFIGEMKTNKQTQKQYIDLQLTPKGFETLQTVATRLPDTILVLVIDDTVVGIFQGLSSIEDPIIPIHGEMNSAEMNWLYNKVKKSRNKQP